MEIPPGEEDWVRAQRMDAAARTSRVLAHEIANYLGSTRALLYLLAEEIGTDPRTREDLDTVVHTVDSATLLVTALRGFAHAPSLGRGPTDLNAVLGETEPALRGLLPAGRTLVVERSGGALPVRADAPRLRQLLVDLVSGANHALPVGGTIEVETGRAGAPGADAATLVVHDDGPEMEADAVARMFEPFVFDHGYDTGLRLPTVYATVTRSGGTITGASAPGDGTTVRVTLPLARDTAAPAEPPRP